jgi:5-methylcytosine-specific restriction endonuclease McrA
MEFKRCCHCKRELPKTSEHYTIDRSRKDGLCNRCKSCESEKEKRYLENNLAKTHERRKKYRDSHRDLMNLYKQRSKAKKKQILSTLTIEQWEDIKKEYGYKCAYCGEKKDLAQDHFIPIYSNGEHTAQNIIPVCKSCNSSKNKKDFFEWYNGKQRKSRTRVRKVLTQTGLLLEKQISIFNLLGDL